MSCPKDNSQSQSAAGQADDRLVDALLRHVCDEQGAAGREARVQRAMQAIRDQTAQSAPAAGPSATLTPRRMLRLPAWTRQGAIAAAAAVLLAFGFWFFTAVPTQALASLDDILSSLGRPGDRTYRITMEDLPEPPGRPDRDQSPPRPTGRVPRPGLDGATLYLRDGSQYVLVRDDPNGGTILDGYDGRQSWRIRRGQIAEVKDGPGAGGIPMPPMMADVPFSDLHRTLEQIRGNYTVEQLDLAALSGLAPEMRHVLVRRNSRQVKGPETIEIWADPKTGLPHRIVFDRAKLQGNHRPCRLTFDLTSQDHLPAHWFAPALHISGESPSIQHKSP